MAVVSRASKYPAATIASVGCGTFRAMRNALMMPPDGSEQVEIGNVEPTVARVARNGTQAINSP